MTNPRIARLGDWLSATMGPAPALDAILARLEDDGRLVAGFSPAAMPFTSAPHTDTEAPFSTARMECTTATDIACEEQPGGSFSLANVVACVHPTPLPVNDVGSHS